MTSLAFRLRQFCAILAISVFVACPAMASDAVAGDIDAAVRALGFLETIQHRSSVQVAVVYRPGDLESKSLAQRVASIMSGLSGPNGASLSVTIAAANELAQTPRKLDVIYLVSGMAEQGRVVADFARRQHVVTVSSDPACLDSQCCALMVRAAARTDIVLDTAVARETGASFSSVFMMLVKRR